MHGTKSFKRVSLYLTPGSLLQMRNNSPSNVYVEVIAVYIKNYVEHKYVVWSKCRDFFFVVNLVVLMFTTGL